MIEWTYGVALSSIVPRGLMGLAIPMRSTFEEFPPGGITEPPFTGRDFGGYIYGTAAVRAFIPRHPRRRTA